MNEHLISSSSSSGSEDENDLHRLTINEHYAKAFQYRKEREELVKLKEKYGSDADTDDPSSDDPDSESDESEDEDGEELTPALDAAILRTLARIKARDPHIYDASRNVFEEEHGKSSTLPAPIRPKKAKAPKPITLPEQRLAAALDVATSRSASPEDPSPPPQAHVAEQAALRAETIAVFHSSAAARDPDAGDAEQEEGGLFTLREKTRDEVEREEVEYRAYLEREAGPVEKILDLGEEIKVEDETRRQGTEDIGAREEKKKSRKRVADERKETDQEFLINYILHRGWIDRSARRIPTYKEITVGATLPEDKDHAETPSGVEVSAHANSNLLEDDDEFDEVAERFESSYNFRFEEPDAAHIASFPRAVEGVRRPTEHAESRRAARERRRKRKEVEKAQRREEVKRLKGLKAREMEAKLEHIGKEGGWARSKALEALDLDGDWDAEAHDQQMAAVLAEIDGVGDGRDDEKPMWEDDIDVDDIIPPSGNEAPRASAAKERKKAKKKERKKRMREDDASAVDVDEMDADAPKDGGSTWDGMEWDGTEEMRKRVLDQYMEELYGLEFNDMVAGMPTHFRYIPVSKTTFALNPTEILLADDKDLNEYVGLKKLAPYRKLRDTWDARRGERLREFKTKVSARVEKQMTMRKGKKERMRERAARAPEECEVAGEVETKATDSPRRSNKHANRLHDEEEGGGYVSMTTGGEPMKKKRRRQKRAERPIEQAVE
ncbi:KRI1-like family C-terminal-domain-containing protein [Russula compacta]|nr:KRI1-like family C-terminal-domain-containing protein [Russula compacta]